MKNPTLGSIVHYVLTDIHGDQHHRPGIVVAVNQDATVNLQVLTDGPNDGGQFLTGRFYAANIAYSQEDATNTWHWGA